MGYDSVGAIRAVMDQETSGRKICFAVQGVVWLLFFGAMGGLYISSLKRANDIDDFLCKDDTTA